MHLFQSLVWQDIQLHWFHFSWILGQIFALQASQCLRCKQGGTFLETFYGKITGDIFSRTKTRTEPGLSCAKAEQCNFLTSLDHQWWWYSCMRLIGWSVVFLYCPPARKTVNYSIISQVGAQSLNTVCSSLKRHETEPKRQCNYSHRLSSTLFINIMTW